LIVGETGHRKIGGFHKKLIDKGTSEEYYRTKKEES